MVENDVADTLTPYNDIPTPQDSTTEDSTLDTFLNEGCKCRLVANDQCCSLFPREHYTSMRNNCAKMTRAELDMAVLGQLSAFTNSSSDNVTTSHHVSKSRKRSYCQFYHSGQRICQITFCQLFNIGSKRFRNLVTHHSKMGLIPRIHGNTGKKPHNATPFASVQFVVRFLHNLVEETGLLLPGRVPGYSRTDVKLLPSSTSKREIWRKYVAAGEATDGVKTVGYSCFCSIWTTLVPQIIVMKPMSDLCWQCQQNSSAIMKAANRSEVEKTEKIQAALDHLTEVKLERTFYNAICKDCQDDTRRLFTINGEISLPQAPTPPNSHQVQAHYSFDMAQQVHFPADPLQPGPIYFLTPRKCGIFGICCEAIPRQINYLTDEAVDCGKGANCIVSRLHHFFHNYGLGESDCFLHADNCVGQNKNHTMLYYLAWRVLTGLHSSITLSFLVVGHTKFSPDWCFGLFKRLFRRTKVNSIKEVADVVKKSAYCNFPQLVADGDTILVHTYDWKSYFQQHFKRVQDLKHYHHFRFTSSAAGKVFCKKRADSEEICIDLRRSNWCPNAGELPPVIYPSGLTTERQWYLYDRIRAYCTDECKDETCPLPSNPRPRTQQQ